MAGHLFKFLLALWIYFSQWSVAGHLFKFLLALWIYFFPVEMFSQLNAKAFGAGHPLKDLAM